MKERFWGRMAAADKSTRIVALLFVAAAIIFMSYCQLGFWSVGIVQNKSVYLMLLLAPLVMGAFLFGPYTGALLGLYAGTVVFLHALFFPLDFYEIYFMTPLNSFVLLTFVGAAAGWAFSAVLRSNPQGLSRKLRIVLVCLAASFVASGLVQLNTIVSYAANDVMAFEEIREYLLISPVGYLLQAFVDAVLMALLCLMIETLINAINAQGENRMLLSIFSSWMLVSSLIVIMLASGVIFSIATMQALSDANDAMNGEIEYLQTHLNKDDFNRDDNPLEGYDVKSDGLVAVTDAQGTILASDSEDQLPVGAALLDQLGYGDSAVSLQEFFNGLENENDLEYIETRDKNGAMTMGISFLAAGPFDEGYVAMVRPSEMVFEPRARTMFSTTAIAIVLIIVIAFTASRLLRQVVIRHIDETNESLDKITHGDLNERVRVRDSREFTSLSKGINTTVSALRDSIAEAERKNAQELAAAKAIQESVLPTDFPAFPNIDKLDIYASMKAAKEVGGDFYDFFEIEGTTKVGFIMADVSGKGIPAALFMMTAKTQIRTYMESGIPVNEAVNAANHQLCLGNESTMFVTMLACELNYETGELEYVNAGHNPPLIQHDGVWEWMRDTSGMPLGIFDGMPYDLIARQLSKNDVLYLYTDGVTEAMSAAGELFGDVRLEDTLRRYSDYNPRSLSVGVRRAITDFTLDCEQSDDITMLCLKYGVPPEEKAVMVLDAKTNQLVHVCNYIHAELHRRRAPKAVYNQLDIATEELFVNVCHYAYPDATPENPGVVRISFEYEPNPPTITVQIADDGIPYNPLEKPDAVTPSDIQQVPIGGLGILMAKQSVDSMEYERAGESNVLTIKKSW